MVQENQPAWSRDLLVPMPRREFLYRLAVASGLAMTTADPVFSAIEQGFRFGRIRCDACDWNTDFAGVGLPGSSDIQFLERLATNTTIRVTPEELSFYVADPLLFLTPLLVVHCHTAFAFTREEIDRLRTAVERGALLLLEDCGGAHPFDRSARTLASQMFPARKLEVVPQSHDLFNCVFQLPFNVGGDKRVMEGMEGVMLEDGRLAVLYSKNDFHCAWEGHACRPGGEPQRDDAFRFGINLVTYVLTH